MLRLFLLRHAKSSWAEAGVKDFDRGLNERGNSDLPKIAAMMKDRGYLPRQIFCSPARRARITLHGIMQAYSEPPNIDYIDRLYSGDADAYINCLRIHSRDEPVMFIGHNPSLMEVAQVLVRNGDPGPLEILSRKYPTGALAVIDFEMAQWSELGPASGFLSDFVIPADL